MERPAGASMGTSRPHNARYWCLGNEMDGPWQMGHMTGRRHRNRVTPRGRSACSIAETSLTRGSSNAIMPTYLDWDREALEECTAPGGRPSSLTILRQQERAPAAAIGRATKAAEPRHGMPDPLRRRPPATMCRASVRRRSGCGCPSTRERCERAAAAATAKGVRDEGLEKVYSARRCSSVASLRGHRRGRILRPARRRQGRHDILNVDAGNQIAFSR